MKLIVQLQPANRISGFPQARGLTLVVCLVVVGMLSSPAIRDHLNACIFTPIHFLQEVTEVGVDKTEMQLQSPCVCLIGQGWHALDTHKDTESKTSGEFLCCSQLRLPLHLRLVCEESADWEIATEGTNSIVHDITSVLARSNVIEINRIIISSFEGLSSVACEKGIIFDDG